LNLPPGPKGFPVLGSVFEPKGDTITYLTKCTREYGDIVFFRFLGVPACYLSKPEYIESVLVTQNNNFVKSKDYRAMRRVLGNGLLLSEGDFWRRQRKLIQPAFHQEKISAYAEIMLDYTERMLETWSDGQPLDIHEAMMRLTLGIVAKTLFDADVSHESEDVDAALAVLMGKFLRQAGMALLLPTWVPLPTSRLLKRAVGRLDKVIYGIIEQRRASGQMSGDLLSAFLQTRDDEGIGMTDRQLHDEIMTLFLAGHETTANVLSWTWLLLGQNPEAEHKLIEELDRVLNGRTPTTADLPRLVYTDMVLRESMRLYPPVWVIGRRALSSFRLGDYEIPANTNMLISQYLMHRDARYFPEPERFDPERWRAGDARSASLPRFAYFPFGGGPRVCIGAGFGMMEAVLLLATIAQKFQIQVIPGEKVSMQPSVTLRPRNGIPVKLKRR
jgi:cytochrome P450